MNTHNVILKLQYIKEQTTFEHEPSLRKLLHEFVDALIDELSGGDIDLLKYEELSNIASQEIEALENDKGIDTEDREMLDSFFSKSLTF